MRSNALSPVRIKVTSESDVLRRVASREEFLSPWVAEEKGRTWVVEPPETIDAADLSQRLMGKAGGAPIPPWAHGTHGRRRKGLAIHRARDALYFPSFGAVLLEDGTALAQSVEEVLSGSPTLAMLPHASRVGDATVLDLGSTDAPVIECGAVFCAAGGPLNYAHFLLDCMTAIMGFRRVGMLPNYPLLYPPNLRPWHWELLSLLSFKAPMKAAESPVHIVRDLLYTNTMAHYLASPGSALGDLRSDILKKEGHPERLIYLSRRGDKKREMVNEAALEGALAERGFEILKPETLTPSGQSSLMNETRILCGASGAGLGNCLFQPKGASVVEIQPSNFPQNFVRAICDEVGLAWYPFFCKSPLHSSSFERDGVTFTDGFAYELPLTQFLRFLDEAVL